MVALIIIGIILGVIAFFALGYYLWSYANENYDYNIFSPGVILRGIASLFCLTFALMLDFGDGSLMVWLFAACILWLWTFLATWRNTNLIIAILALVFQVMSVIFVLQVINRVKRGLS